VLANIYPTAQCADELKPYIEADEILTAAIELFAWIPGLPKHLLERAEGDKAANKVPSFFNYLFEGSSSPAIGANYNVVGYRLRDMDEWGLVGGAADGNFSNFDGHDVTHEMIRAGELRVQQLVEAETSSAYVAEEVYRAMVRASRP
jgi:hypothetical protein